MKKFFFFLFPLSVGALSPQESYLMTQEKAVREELAIHSYVKLNEILWEALTSMCDGDPEKYEEIVQTLFDCMDDETRQSLLNIQL